MMETGCPNDDIYTIVVECLLLFDYLVAPTTANLSSKGSYCSPKDGQLSASPEPAIELEIGFGREDKDERRNRMEDIKRSFNLWINYTGALAAVGRSLDDRLFGHTDIKEMVVELLEMLTRNLQFIYSRETAVPPISKSPTPIQSKTSEEQAWIATEQAIEELHFMAAAIRRSSVNSEKYNLSSKFDKDDDLYFEERAKILIKRYFPHARRSLCEQFAASMAVRRKRLLNMKLREDKLKERRDPVPIGPKLPYQAKGSVSGPSISPSQSLPRPNPLQLKRLKKENNHPSGTENTMSSLDSAAVRSRVNRGPSYSTVSMGTSVQNSAIDYPKIPQLLSSSKHCACPYCGKLLEVEKLQKNPNYWNKHIDQDVKPYVCLSEECTSPFLFFSNMHEWLNHMKALHSNQWARKIHMTTWYCDIDHENAFIQFNDYLSFVKHMKDPHMHPKRPLPTDLQLEALSRNKRKVLVREEEYSCPLCDCVPDSISPITQTSNSNDVRERLGKHIANHIKNLAFISVPKWTIADPDENAVSDADAKDNERRRMCRDNSSALGASGFDSDIYAISLSFIEYPQRPHLGIIEDDFEIPSTHESNVHDIYSNNYQLCEISGDNFRIPDTRETYWDDIGFNDNKSRNVAKEEVDVVLNHFALIQHPAPIDDWGFEEELPATLSDQILGKCVNSRFDKEIKKFLPAGCIDDLVSLEAIIKELMDKHHSRPEDLVLPTGKQKVVDFVFEKAKKVFAIAVISGLHGPQLGKATLGFMKINFTDSCLPLTEEDLAKIPFFRDVAPPWSKTRIYNFCREQWTFLAPVFSQRNFKVDLRPEHILPFIMKSEVVKEGAFGQVFMVEVHPTHQEDSILNSDGSPAKLAIKEFMNPTNEDEQLQQDAEAVWNSEVSTLDEISGLRHENLIQRIAAITRGKKRYLMFLWAEGGNLRDFWEDHPKPKVKAALVKDIIQQLRGMADALNKLHNYKGQPHFRHGDIKPENILNFPDADKSRIGTFKISDMGSAKSHAAATRLRERTAGNKFATMVYQAPEAITQKAGSTSPLYDIWSIGCVTLELMVWLLYGYDELQEFKNRIKGPYGESSSFFVTTEVEEARREGIITKRVAQIHPAVQTCLDDLSNDEECAGNTALGDLLEIIKTKLLVITLPERSPSTNDHEPGESFSVTNADDTSARHQAFGMQRATAGGFLDALDRILLSSDDSKENYWFTGRSRGNIRLSNPIPKIIADDNPSSSLYVGWEPDADQTPSTLYG